MTGQGHEWGADEPASDKHEVTGIKLEADRVLARSCQVSPGRGRIPLGLPGCGEALGPSIAASRIGGRARGAEGAQTCGLWVLILPPG